MHYEYNVTVAAGGVLRRYGTTNKITAILILRTFDYHLKLREAKALIEQSVTTVRDITVRVDHTPHRTETHDF